MSCGKSSGVRDLAKLTEVSSPTSTEADEIRASLLRVSPDSVSPSAFEVRLRCPFCAEETFLGDRFCQECGSIQPAFADNSVAFFDKAKELLATKKQLLCAISIVTMIGGLLFYAVFTSLSLPGELEQSLKANRLNESVRLSEQLLVARFGSLTGKDAELYCTSFHRRALVYGSNNNAKGALVDLARILPTYSQKAEVDRLTQFYTASLLINQPVAPNSSSLKKAESGIANDAAGQSKLNAHESSISRQTVSQTQNSVRASLTSKDLSKTPTTSASAAAAAVDNGEDDDAKEEKEMAHYNNMLAEYFSKKKQGDTPPGNAETVKEPPSFNEWVQSGKAEF